MREGPMPNIMADALASLGPQGQLPETIPDPLAGSSFEQALWAGAKDGVEE